MENEPRTGSEGKQGGWAMHDRDCQVVKQIGL